MTSDTRSTTVALQGIRIETRQTTTYWIEEKPKGWTNQEWIDTIEAARRGDVYDEGVEALIVKENEIESDHEVDRVVWETT